MKNNTSDSFYSQTYVVKKLSICLYEHEKKKIKMCDKKLLKKAFASKIQFSVSLGLKI